MHIHVHVHVHVAYESEAVSLTRGGLRWPLLRRSADCCRVRARDYVVTSGRPAINGWSASPRAGPLHLHGAACDVLCFPALQTQRSRTSAVLFHLHGAVCDVSCSSLARERVPDVSSGRSAINGYSALPIESGTVALTRSGLRCPLPSSTSFSFVFGFLAMFCYEISNEYFQYFFVLKFDQYGKFWHYLLEQITSWLKAAASTTPCDTQIKKHVKNEKKKYQVTFSCRYVSKLESNKSSLLQIILLKWDWYIHVIILLQCHVPCSRYLFLILNYKSILINHKYATVKIAFK